MEAHTSCCCLREYAVSHLLFSPLNHRIHLGPPSCPILCHFHPFCANALCHCLLPSPHPGRTSTTLRSQFFLQLPQPFHVFQREDAIRFTLWVHFCHTRHITAPREVTCEVHFITMQGFVLCPTVVQQFFDHRIMCASAVSVGRLGTCIIRLCILSCTARR